MNALTFKQSLYAAFDKLGKSNGHNVPTSQDPITSVLHEYHVTTLAESYFKKRREVAKKNMLSKLSAAQVARLEKATKDIQPATLVESEHYNMQVKPKNGASFLDEAKLRNTLMTKHKLKHEQVEALFNECMGRRDPSLSFEVTEK